MRYSNYLKLMTNHFLFLNNTKGGDFMERDFDPVLQAAHAAMEWEGAPVITEQIISPTKTRVLDSVGDPRFPKVVGRTPEGFHREDMREWCAAAVHANPGFNCPDPYTLPGYFRRR